MIRLRSAGVGLLGIGCALWSSCNRQISPGSSPTIRFTSVPLAQPGDPNKLTVVKGRVAGAQRNQRVVLYAKTESTWWVQPFANQPFTKIEPDATWTSSTHPGQEYAALLVGPEFRLIVTTGALPTAGVASIAVTKGRPPFWQTWWFLSVCGFAGLSVALGFHLLRLKQITDQLNVRFEERLAERTRVAQLLHDTLLQGVVSASMQLHVAVDQLPSDSPVVQPLHRTLQSIRRVVEEGRNTLHALQSPMQGLNDLERSLAQIPQELDIQADARVRVIVKGPVCPLQSNVCAELYMLGREALINAFRRWKAANAEVELRFSVSELRLLIRDDGDPSREGPGELSGVRARAEKIGARLKVRGRMGGGNEVEVRVPGHVAFEFHDAAPASGCFNAFRRWNPGRFRPTNRSPPGSSQTGDFSGSR